MRINNREMTGPKELTLVVPLGDEDFVFKFKTVLDDSEFDRLCPYPKPQRARLPNNQFRDKTDDPAYIKQCDDWQAKRRDWLFLESISATDGLTWETVVMDNPDTYRSWEAELTKAGFAYPARKAIYAKFIEANAMTDEMLEQAKARFLASQQAAQSPPLIPPEDQTTTSSGEDASVSE